ncbi:alpha/beta family hydrolase [Neptunicella sp. SCSIO 80796]|uniref:alpha/beta family hydrolase n=1 Tax=Neptunicella plasticusilytica TaxID=3117012 RepID=UPI003A4D986E
MVSSSQPFAELILAHGAGAGMHSEFIQDIAARLTALGILVNCFDFPYMQTMQQSGKRRPPDRMPILQQAFIKQVQQRTSGLPLFIGGKSMGGRVASMILGEVPAVAGVCLGYPFHPPGKPQKLRTEHLFELTKPLLVVQGAKDSFGRASEITDYKLPDNVRCQILAAGDHSFKPSKTSGYSHAEHMDTAAGFIHQFIQEQL